MSEENLIVEQEEVVDAIMETVIHDENEPVVSTKRLLEAGCHFGHQTRRWNPKMAQYIYGSRNGVYIIDLVRTAQKIQEAYQALKKIVLNGGKVLFVGTKKQCQEIIQEEALRSGSFYVATRWLGGTLTNFKTIQKRIKYLNNLEVMEEDGSFDSMPKKEAVKLRKEKEKLLKNLDGIKAMRKVPNAIFVVDPKLEHNAVAEARKLKIPVFAICDTNSDPTEVDYAIPSNDDAVKAIKLIVGLLADAVVEAKGGQTVVAYGVQPDEEVSMIDALNSFDKAEELKQIRQKAREDMLASKRKDGRPRPTRKSTAKYEQKVEEAKVEAPAEAKEETSVETTEEVKPIKKVSKVAKKTEEVKEEATEEAKVETTEEVKPTKKVSKAAKKVEDKTDTLVEAKEEVTEKAKPTKTVGKVAKKTEEVKEAKVAETTEVKSTKKTSKATKKTEEVKEEATEEAKPVKKVRKTTKKVEETLVENKE